MALLGVGRTVRSVKIGENEVRHTVKIQMEATGADGPIGLQAKFDLLRLIAADPAFTTCGYQGFRTLKVWHDGTSWTADAEAIETVAPS